MKVYVIHYKPLKERITKVMDLLFSCDSVEDIEVVTSETSILKFATEEENNGVLPEDFPQQTTTDLERSVYHKHFRVFKKIAESRELAIVLEDDALFDPKELDRFIAECEEVPPGMGWCFFGTGLGIRLPGRGFIPVPNRLKSKCADSMLIDPTAARVIFNDLLTDMVRGPIDWDLNYRFIKHDINVYWYEPGIVIQGSENGTYPCCHNR